MKGFFDIKPIKPKPKKKKWTCNDCGLYKGCETPKMGVVGKGEKKVLLVAESPGKTEDLYEDHFSGPAGIFFRKILTKHHIDLERDCWKTNAICCRPPGNRTPTSKEINCCRHRLLESVAELKPEKIILLGKTSLASFLGDKISSLGGIFKWKDWAIPDQEYQAWVFPILHPNWLLKEQNPMMNKLYSRDVRNIFKWNKEFPDYGDETSKVETETDEESICDKLEELLHFPVPIAFDYETTGIKPHIAGHDIRCASISWDRNKAFAFPLESKKVRRVWVKILRDPKIKKIAHNAAFEAKWGRNILKTKTRGWTADTMLTAHILDNRAGICGLKFQTYMRYGCAGYGDEVHSYLKSTGKSSYGFNTVFDAPTDQLLKYCAMDSMFTFRLWEDQKQELKKSKELTRADNFFFDGLRAIIDVEHNGITLHTKHYEKQIKHLSRQIKHIESQIQRDPIIQDWNRTEKKKFNPASPNQLSKIITNYLRTKIIKTTASGKASMDEETIEKLGRKYPLMGMIVELRKKSKLQSTYLEPFVRESPTGVLYPNFLLHRVQTYRSSSSNPNFQNIPKRDLNAQKITRSGIIPRSGRLLMEVDYSGIEVRIAACYHKDPVMIDYITGGGDMHRDVAADIFMMPAAEVTPEQRYYAKNQFVFPQFYGSYYGQCAENLWKSVENDPLIMDQLNENGIYDYSRFENHVKKAENIFWNDRFKVYTQWKKDFFNQYEKTGQIELKTGFVCKGFMVRNDVLNYPIQGAAFHCLLWSLTTLQKMLTKMKFESLIVGQIHDSIILDIVPEELEELKPIIRRIMCDDIREYWPWIIIPLDVEADVTEIDGNWFETKTLEL